MTQFVKSSLCKDCKDCDTKSPLFRHLTENELGIVNESRYEVKFKAGEIIIKQGSRANHIITLTSGLGKIYLESHNNKNFILKFISPSEVFGGPGVFSDGRNHYSVAAVEEVTCCFMDADVFKFIVSQNILFANEIIRKINFQATRNFDRFISLTQKQMPGRIAEAILYFSKEVYKSNPFTLTFSRQDFADYVGFSKESTIRILKDFRTENLIKNLGNTMEILNTTQLEKISQTG